MDCFTGLVSFLFFIFTTLLWIVGLGMIGVATYWYVEYNYLNDAADTDTLSYVSIAVIVLGVILLLMGLLGSCGTCKKSKCMLYFFAVLLSVIVILQLALCIYSFVEKGDVKDQIKTGLEKTAEQYLEDKSTMKTWDDIQKNVKCCGAYNGYEDWNTIIKNKMVPKSCCKNDACKQTATECEAVDGDNSDGAECVQSMVTTNIYTDGCGSKVVDAVEDNLIIVGAVLLVFVFLQLLGIFSAVMIAKSVESSSPRYA